MRPLQQFNPHKIVLAGLSIVALLSIACHTNDESAIDQARAIPSGQTPDQPSKQAATIDSETALRIAQVCAFEHHRLPQPIHALGEARPNGDWLVSFSPGGFLDRNGKSVGYNINWGMFITVTPAGLCSAWTNSGQTIADNGFVPSGDYLRDSPLLEPRDELLNEEVAILLATSFAVRKGLIESNMTAEQSQAPDGSWVISFAPGTCLPREPAMPLKARRPFVAVVSPDGNCRLIPEVDDDPASRTPHEAAEGNPHRDSSRRTAPDLGPVARKPAFSRRFC